jgi:alkylhydroperoxidase family enzyme
MKDSRERIRMLEREEVSPEVGGIYDQLLAQRGVVPYMFKTLAHTPELALGVAAFLKPLMADGALAGWYKELVATRVALLNDCDY